MVRRAYAAFKAGKEDEEALDFFFYLWCGKNSPLYGREKLTTFERLYIDDKAYHREQDNSYIYIVRKRRSANASCVIRHSGKIQSYHQRARAGAYEVG